MRSGGRVRGSGRVDSHSYNNGFRSVISHKQNCHSSVHHTFTIRWRKIRCALRDSFHPWHVLFKIHVAGKTYKAGVLPFNLHF